MTKKTETDIESFDGPIERSPVTKDDVVVRGIGNWTAADIVRGPGGRKVPVVEPVFEGMTPDELAAYMESETDFDKLLAAYLYGLQLHLRESSNPVADGVAIGHELINAVRKTTGWSFEETLDRLRLSKQARHRTRK